MEEVVTEAVMEATEAVMEATEVVAAGMEDTEAMAGMDMGMAGMDAGAGAAGITIIMAEAAGATGAIQDTTAITEGLLTTIILIIRVMGIPTRLIQLITPIPPILITALITKTTPPSPPPTNIMTNIAVREFTPPMRVAVV